LHMFAQLWRMLLSLSEAFGIRNYSVVAFTDCHQIVVSRMALDLARICCRAIVERFGF